MHDDNGYGIEIAEKITIKNIVLLVGKSEIIILPQDLSGAKDFYALFIVLNHFLKKKKESVFGLFFDKNFLMFRKLLQKEFIDNFCEENLVALLEATNMESYYEYKKESVQTLGVEVRFKRGTEDWWDSNKDIREILNEVRELNYNRAKE